MDNPFETIQARLDRLEAVSKEVLHFLQNTTQAPSEVGGLKLAQEVTRLSKPRIYALVSARAIPHAKRGNRLYFNRDELLAWVAQGRRATKTRVE